MEELIYGHPDCIWTELGMSVHFFLALIEKLRSLCHLENRKHVSFKEGVAIFLYMCVTGLSIWYVGE